MSGYRKVNYYELCRLCTSSEGNKMNIFRDEGRRRQLQTKIQTYLPIQIMEEDSLPKIVCHECVKKLENFIEFRETVVNAEGMLESYFTSLRYSEEFLKEGKVYVKSTEKERSSTPEDEVLKSMEKVGIPGNQIISNDQVHQQPVVVGNINASNIQIISGVQARVQQYKCAMQMQPGGMAAAVVEATAETHYSYQQQTSQISPQQSNEIQNQISDQRNQSSAIQAQSQIQSQISQQVQSQRPISQQLDQSAQLAQQQNQTQVGQQQQQEQSQITQQLQQLQRQQREFEKQHRQLQQFEKQQVQITTQREFSVKQESSVVHQNNNIVLKSETDVEPTQIIQKIQSETQKNEPPSTNVQTYATVQTPPEVFLNLGFKESSIATSAIQEDTKDFKEFAKTSSDDGISRNSIEQIREFLRLRSGPEPTSLITVNAQVISQINRSSTAVCRDCGKSFPSLSQMNGHNCNVETLINETGDTENKDDTLQNSVNPFNCDICSKPFKRKEHLFQHRKLHTGERPYVCTTCTKAFSRKEHLVRHSVSHTGQKMHECEMCGKSFSRKDNLHKHRKTHGVSGPYICETCGKSFVVKHYYVMHLTTHASTGDLNCPDPLPYKCDICHKAFSVKQYLTTHKLRHRSKNNNSSVQNTLNEHQQQPQRTDVASNVNGVTNNVTNDNGQSNNETTVEMQSVIERNEQANGSFANSQYHTSIQEFQ